MSDDVVTPYTGGKENSSLGLFFLDIDGEGISPSIAVNINSKADAEAMKSTTNTLRKAVKDETLNAEWTFALAGDDETVEGFVIGIRAHHKEDGQLLFESAAAIPLAVAYGWLKEIQARKSEKVNLIVMPTGGFSGMKQTNDTDDGYFETHWELENEEIVMIGKTLIRMETLAWDDKIFGNEHYRKDAMELMNFASKKKGW